MKARKFAWMAGATVLLLAGSAQAAPLAASVASPPLVVAGMLVGLVLLVVFVGLLVRTFRSMRATRDVSDVEIVRREAGLRLSDWENLPDLETVRGLVDLLKECDTDEERSIVTEALSRVSGRFFGPDELAWEVWLRRDAEAHVLGARSQQSSIPPAGEYLPVS
jgi:hypothetical protein